MRFGLIGPAATDASALEQAAKLLIGKFEVDAMIYLTDDQALRTFIALHQPHDGERSVHERIGDVAATGSPEEIRDVLRRLRGARYLEKLRIAPEPPTRALEMADDRIVLIVRNKALIAEEDVINSNIVIYGDAKELLFKRFGPRCFFSPGPLSAGHVGLLDDESEAGGVVLRALDIDGHVVWNEPIQGRGAKIMVAS